MSRFRLGRAATRDIDEICNYIANDSIDAADRVADSLLQACRLIGQNPVLGHKREDLAGNRPVRFWPVGNYLLIYRPDTRPVEIVAVVHGGRDIPKFLRRRLP